MNTKKRYDTPKQIQDRVNLRRADVVRHLEMADAMDKEAGCMAGLGHYESAAMKREEAKKRRRMAFRIENVTIPKLVGKLGEIMTPVFPAIDNGDKSITVKG